MGEPAAILRLLNLPDVEDRPNQKQFWFFCPNCSEVRGKTTLDGRSDTLLQCHACHELFYLHTDNSYICLRMKKHHDDPVQREHAYLEGWCYSKILCPVCKHEDFIYTDLADHELSFVCKKCASHYTVRVSDGWLCIKPTEVKDKENKCNDSR